MRRRTALTLLASAGSSLIAGCSLDRKRRHEKSTAAAERSTETTRTATEASRRSDRRPGDVPADRIVDGEAVSATDVGVTANRWFGLERLRYRDESGDAQTVTADRGRFVAYEFTVANRGESHVEALPDAAFRLGIDGETYDHLHEFPGGVAFSALDQPKSEPRIRPLAWYDGLDPGAAVSLQLVYDAPVRPEYRHYLVWDPESPVEGATDPAYLTGRPTLDGDDGSGSPADGGASLGQSF